MRGLLVGVSSTREEARHHLAVCCGGGGHVRGQRAHLPAGTGPAPAGRGTARHIPGVGRPHASPAGKLSAGYLIFGDIQFMIHWIDPIAVSLP